MPSNTEHDRNRAHLASVLRLLLGPMALLVSLFHAEPVSAASPAVASIAPPSENAAVDAGVWADAELPMCDLTGSSLAVPPGSCSAVIPDAVIPDAVIPEAVIPDAVIPDGVTPDVVARAARDEAGKAPADRAPAKAAPMCASDATSIAAPVEIPEVDRGHFEPLPCDAQALLSLFGSWPREGSMQRITARESPPRNPLPSPALNDRNDGVGAPSMPLYWPERAAPSTLAIHWGGGLAWQAGHRSRIDRPPSLRA
jgi:hypothetical protein